jgi:DNA binding domain, excisionase family
MQNWDEEEELLTIQEVARRLRVHDSTIRRWAKSGYLDAIPLPKGIGQKQSYRIKRSTLNELLRQARQ